MNDYGDITAADRKLADALNQTNLVVMGAAWIVFPRYRKYLSGPIEDRARKIFIVPCESLLYALQRKERYETVPEGTEGRGEGAPVDAGEAGGEAGH